MTVGPPVAPSLDDLVRRAREQLADALGPARTCAIADFPRHLNVGDSAIWLGERAALAAAGIRVTASCDKRSYSRRRFARALGDGVLCIHGGGNFGDLYPGHHELRENLLRDFRHRPIVQLPQTIRFSGAAALERARRLIGQHGDVTIMVRDQASEDLARRNFEARVVLAPDGAFALGRLCRTAEPAVPLIVQSRTDKERADGERRPGGETFDWLARPTDARSRGELRLLEARLSLTCGSGRRRSPPLAPSQVLRAYDGYARWNVQRGTKMLSRGEVVVTDRLHGHILCLLLSVPHVVVDDRHGKIASFFQAWTRSCPGAHWAGSAPEASALARTLVGAGRASGAVR